MSFYDLTLLPQPVAQLTQEALKARGLYEGTTLGKPAGNSQRAFDQFVRLCYPQLDKAWPTWMLKAETYLGTREIPGAQHEPAILRWWAATVAWIRDDETPWCAAFVGGVLEECGYGSTKSASARSYLNWGKPLDEPALGAVVIFWRGSRSSWKGHVGFVRGVDQYGNVICLGGNQDDEVNVKTFPRDRVLGYRWPNESITPDPGHGVPILAGHYGRSGSEA